MKTKVCHTCREEYHTLFRVQLEKGKTWVFVCPSCCEQHKASDGYYRYGGAWKGARH